MRTYLLRTEAPGMGATLLTRRMARRRNGILRAPHHTCSKTALSGELAISAGGTLYLGDILEWTRSSLMALHQTWVCMHPNCRPDLVLGAVVSTPEDESRLSKWLESLPVVTHSFKVLGVESGIVLVEKR